MRSGVTETLVNVWVLLSYPMTFAVLAKVGGIGNWVGAGHLPVPTSVWLLGVLPALTDGVVAIAALATGAKATALFAGVSAGVLALLAVICIQGLHVT